MRATTIENSKEKSTLLDHTSSTRFIEGRPDEKEQHKKVNNIAPSFVKFYKYEEIKQKYNIQNLKDKMRQRLHDKMREQEQNEMHKLNLNYKVDRDILEDLHQREAGTLVINKSIL